MDTYGYLYKDNFDPNNPYINQLLYSDSGCSNSQFRLTADLQSNTTYILVVTTYYPNVTGLFSVISSGPKNVNLKGISEYNSTLL